MRADNAMPWAARHSNPEVSAGSALFADLTRPGTKIITWLDSQHWIAHTPARDGKEGGNARWARWRGQSIGCVASGFSARGERALTT
jgi:hypothetical protein